METQVKTVAITSPVGEKKKTDKNKARPQMWTRPKVLLYLLSKSTICSHSFSVSLIFCTIPETYYKNPVCVKSRFNKEKDLKRFSNEGSLLGFCSSYLTAHLSLV